MQLVGKAMDVAAKALDGKASAPGMAEVVALQVLKGAQILSSDQRTVIGKQVNNLVQNRNTLQITVNKERKDDQFAETVPAQFERMVRVLEEYRGKKGADA